MGRCVLLSAAFLLVICSEFYHHPAQAFLASSPSLSSSHGGMRRDGFQSQRPHRTKTAWTKTAATGGTRTTIRRFVSSTSTTDNDILDDPLLQPPSSYITPEGFGFTTTMSRIMSLSGSAGRGYYRARASDTVIEVMEAITSAASVDERDNAAAVIDRPYDVALVFDDEDPNKLLGLFTEKDYIRFSTERSKAPNEEESARYLIAPIREHMTPSDQLITLSTTSTANVAIASMKQANVRHIVVADKVDMNRRRLLPNSQVLGVVSMQDVMNIIQRDERLSLTSLAQKYPGIRNPIDQMREEMKFISNEKSSDPETAKKDIIKVGTTIFAVLSLVAFFSQASWFHDNAQLAMIAIFVLGYAGIIFEELFEFDKAGVALLMSTGLWVTYADYYESTGKASGTVLEQLKEQLADVSDICFFLLAASTIVEVVDAHQGFKVVTDSINTNSKKQLFWIVGFLTFFLSSILNNLTVTIVMISLLRKLVPNEDDRKLFGAMVVVAANAGGVWTPIGDVTTTMLWINHQLSTVPTILELAIPSTVCLVASLAFLVNQVKEDEVGSGALPLASSGDQAWAAPVSQRGKIVFWTGIASLLSVPVFNELTGLPPYLAMLTGLGVIWTLTDVLHLGEDDKEELKVPKALSNLDTAGILFFLGILMSIGVLDKSGLLKDLAVFLSDNLPNLDIIATVIGIASALIDNVPLVAATMGMYELTDFPTDDRLWQLIALCAGTGGSILVIGSASGVALMGLEKVDFMWYAKHVSVGAAVGYFAGIATYLLQDAIVRGGVGNMLAGIMPQAAVAADVLTQHASAAGIM